MRTARTAAEVGVRPNSRRSQDHTGDSGAAKVLRVILAQPFSFSGWVTAYPAVSRGPFVPDPLISLDLIGA